MPNRIGLLFEDWPAEDRRAWLSATSADDFFGTDARASHWRPKTRYQAMTANGRWLAFLTAHYPEALREPAASRVTTQRVTDYVRSLRPQLSDMGLSADLNHLAMAISAIAPEADLVRLKQAQKACARAARPRERRDKIVDARRIFELGIALMDSAISESRQAVARLDFRDGLLIALLVSRPVRRKNLSEIQIGINLIARTDGFDLCFAGDSTKNGAPIEFDVPRELVKYVRLYLERFRALFPGASAHSRLWTSAKGGPLTEDAIYNQVCKRTKLALGTEISPHLFRSIASTTLVQYSPQHSRVASDLLGHTKTSTTDRFYTRANTIEASRYFARLAAPSRKGRGC